MRQAFPALMFLTVALAALTALDAQAATELGQPAPALLVQELNGQTFDLAALRGKVVVINFWATWCPPCRQEMPTLDAFYRRHHG
jgi:thiol-disulfide isomerase/thioredoxin